jgi:ribonucleoside-diphosphate reductase alpha subunit
MNDLFMEKLIEGDDDWYLFCPHDLMKIGIDLHDAWGEEFKVLYNQAVEAGIGKLVSLSSLASEIAVSVIESGKYYMLFKDEINSKSMHSHMGTIKSSNLCTEVVQYTDTYTVANCVLISLVLPNFIDEQGSILLNKMRKSVKIGVGMLNHIIDNNNFLTPESEKGAIEQRALGIGVAGLADCYTSLGYPFQSDEANELNKGLFQSLYLSALEASCSMAREKGLPSGMRWEASKYSKGLLHCDQYIDDERGTFTEEDAKAFDEVRKDIMEYGLYNTLFIAPMPTASSSNVAGVIESFEPIKSLLYTREIDGVKYTIINKQFVKDCEGLDIWSKALSDDLLRNGGILEGVDLAKYLSANPMVDDRERVNIESKLRKIYKTAYEKGMNRSIQIQARDRLPYVDQSQSMNLFTTSTSESTYWSMMVAGWKMGLKTGCYYLRSQSKGKADQGLVLQEGSACGIGGCEV